MKQTIHRPVGPRGGALHVSPLSTLSITGPGNSIGVGGTGQAILLGTLNAVLDNPRILPILSPNAAVLGDGRASVGGNVNVTFTNPLPSLANGAFVPLVSAKAIEFRYKTT